ncbi:MAG: hypothetical protein HOV87_34175 [Catenulispora sp.]|nr:hypothetical protein [Catenulispora sp.]
MTTAVGFAFPTTNWLDPFDADEVATQWFFGNQDRISRAWIAPVEQDRGWGFTEEDKMWQFFNNPRSCLYCLEKTAIVAGGQVLREWPQVAPMRQGAPASCSQHNGLYVVYRQAQEVFPVSEATKYAAYDEALAEALAESLGTQNAGARTMVARLVSGESLW